MLQRIFISADLEHIKDLRQDTTDNTIAYLQYTPEIQTYFENWVKGQKEISLDIETSHFDPTMGKILLTSFYAGNTVITFDNLTIPVTDMCSTELLSKSCIVAHNAKFEILWFLREDIHFKKVFCTMLADQKLLQGAGVEHNIKSVLTRRGVAIPEDMDKAIREEFVNGTYTKPLLKHILYNQADTLCLLELKKIQEELIQQFNLTFHLNQIHFPLIRTLALAELEGIRLDEEKFLTLAKVAENAMLAIEKEIEAWIKTNYPAIDLTIYNKPIVEKLEGLTKREIKIKERAVKLTDILQKYTEQQKTHLKAFSIASSSLMQCDGDLVEVYTKRSQLEKTSLLSWTSGKQVIALLESLNCSPLPKAKDVKTKVFKPSLAKAPRERWLLQNPNNPLFFLIKKYDEYMRQTKHVNSFGQSFITKYKHPVTGKFHTNYKQGTVETGRLASGNSTQVPARFNSQQLPGLIRECFIADPGYLIATCDLSGAELVTMCSLAQDTRLLEISKSTDLHSYFANKGWEAIYASRNIPWTAADVISPEQNTKKRKGYKPMMFGTVYGLKGPKAAETLNVTEKEGTIAINTIVKEIPLTIKMVEQATRNALKDGYIIHNNRTNSRRWFPPVLEEQATGTPMRFLDRIAVEGASRNTRIQGTQSDMLCEAMVLLQRFIDFYKIDACLLMQVHDELVVKFKESDKAWFPQRVKDCMTRSADKYLVGGIQMGGELKIGPTWVK